MNDVAYGVGTIIGIAAFWILVIVIYVKVVFAIIRTEKHTKEMVGLLRAMVERDRVKDMIPPRSMFVAANGTITEVGR